MGGWPLGGCQISHWEIWLALNGCWLLIQRECKIVQSCSGENLFCGTVISAWYYL
jgi:hypothetical protein